MELAKVKDFIFKELLSAFITPVGLKRAFCEAGFDFVFKEDKLFLLRKKLSTFAGNKNYRKWNN